ncbi:uncharacterized protein LOC141592433 [Silene latifolia]|uniref:uncharacterized protein LOC141592433 n=1 Tax=Silene latifolia TaxID=37657 RepID=UPI003D783FE9
MAAMAPERGVGGSTSTNNGGNNGARTLHNFSLPPCLSWGTQKLLRCSNSTSSLNDAVTGSPPSKRRRHSPRDDNQIEVMREKLMFDLRSEVDKMRAVFLGNGHPPPAPPLNAAAATTEVRPWNLRTRRAACGGDRVASPVRQEVVSVAAEEEEAVPRAKFSVPLSRQEVEDDFVAMLGRRPPRKPKKRPRYIQKQLETVFPGVWLSEITADMYKVDETPEPPK